MSVDKLAREQYFEFTPEFEYGMCTMGGYLWDDVLCS